MVIGRRRDQLGLMSGVSILTLRAGVSRYWAALLENLEAARFMRILNWLSTGSALPLRASNVSPIGKGVFSCGTCGKQAEMPLFDYSRQPPGCCCIGLSVVHLRISLIHVSIHS